MLKVGDKVKWIAADRKCGRIVLIKKGDVRTVAFISHDGSSMWLSGPNDKGMFGAVLSNQVEVIKQKGKVSLVPKIMRKDLKMKSFTENVFNRQK